MPVVMTGRERVTRAIERSHPDCIPVLHKIQDGALYEHGAALYHLAARCPEDSGDLTPASCPMPRPDTKHFVNGTYRNTYVDGWGVTWEQCTYGIMGHVVHYLVEEPDDLKKVCLPDIPEPGSTAARNWAEDVANHQARGFYRLEGWVTLFETLHSLRRMEDLLIDIAEDNALANDLADLVMGVRSRQIESLLDAGVDGIQLADDWGSQQATLISRPMWQHFFKPRYRQLAQQVRARGKHVFFHSCGHTLPFFDDLAEIGVQVIWPQAGANNQVEVAAAIRRNGLTLQWDIDRQHTMSQGSPAEVAAAVAAAKQRFYDPAGGLIFWGELFPGYPLANVETLFDSLQRQRFPENHEPYQVKVAP
ncbi:MAG: uroporphyrinogen decarboxylase family protein [bacterium]